MRLLILTAVILFGILTESVYAKQVLQPAAASAADKAGGKISPGLQRMLDQADESQPLRVIVRLKSGAAADQSDSIVKNRRARHIRKLKDRARNKQGKILSLLDDRRSDLVEKLRKKGKLKRHKRQDSIPQSRGFWLVNCVAATVSPQDLKEIATRSDVLEITENTVMSVPPVTTNDSGTSGPVLNLWNLSAIGLDQISGLGIDGQGVRLGVIDTGLDPSHPDLAGKLIGWAEFGSHGEVIQSEPHDTHLKGHGTHVASVMAGDVTGVAPGASLIAALALPGGSGTMEQVLAGMQWILDPDNDPETDDGAQVVNMSWGSFGTSDILREATENMTAAGVLPVGAIGNYGPGTSIAPGNTPGAIGAAALDSMDYSAYFSGGGEVCWDDICILKPDVGAPGVDITGIGADGNYQTRSGTSFAAPHIAAAAALLLAYHPDLSLAQIKAFLLNSARDLGPIGPDDHYGRGALDLQSAFDFMQRYEQRFDSNDLVLGTVETAPNEEIYRFYSYFSDGDGSFTETAISPEIRDASGTLHIVGLGDVNGDGYADLVVEQTHPLVSGDYEISYQVFPSLDAGGFAPQPDTWRTEVAPEPLKTIGLTDANGDGYADLILVETEAINTIDYQSRVYVALSNGKSGFQAGPEPWLSLSHNIYFKIDYGLGDINGDGLGDLLISQRYRYFNAPNYYYLAVSVGTSYYKYRFLSATVSSVFNGPLRLVTCADVNGDGLEDLILSAEVLPYATSVPVYVCLGTVTGVFRTEQRWAEVSLQPGGSIAAATDADGDGAADLVVKTAGADPKIEVWLSNWSSGFVKEADSGIGDLSGLTDMEVTFVGVGNVGMGNWR